MGTEKRRMQINRPDLRRMRAQQFTAAIFQELSDIIPDDSHRTAHERLFQLFYDNGWAVTTDEERHAQGLEPRDDLGWTPSERVEEKRRKLEVMHAMANIIVSIDKTEGNP